MQSILSDSDNLKSSFKSQDDNLNTFDRVISRNKCDENFDFSSKVSSLYLSSKFPVSHRYWFLQFQKKLSIENQHDSKARLCNTQSHFFITRFSTQSEPIVDDESFINSAKKLLCQIIEDNDPKLLNSNFVKYLRTVCNIFTSMPSKSACSLQNDVLSRNNFLDEYTYWNQTERDWILPSLNEANKSFLCNSCSDYECILFEGKLTRDQISIKSLQKLIVDNCYSDNDVILLARLSYLNDDDYNTIALLKNTTNPFGLVLLATSLYNINSISDSIDALKLLAIKYYDYQVKINEAFCASQLLEYFKSLLHDQIVRKAYLIIINILNYKIEPEISKYDLTDLIELNMLGATFANQKKFDQAIILYEKCINNQIEMPPRIKTNLSIAKFNTGELETASSLSSVVLRTNRSEKAQDVLKLLFGFYKSSESLIDS